LSVSNKFYRKDAIKTEWINLSLATSDSKREVSFAAPGVSLRHNREKTSLGQPFSVPTPVENEVVKEMASDASVTLPVEASGEGLSQSRTSFRCGLGDTKTSSKSDVAEVGVSHKSAPVAKRYSQIQLFIRQPKLKARLLEARRSSREQSVGKNGQSYVSRCLFPISTRKNSANRRSLEKGDPQKQNLTGNTATRDVRAQNQTAVRGSCDFGSNLFNNSLLNGDPKVFDEPEKHRKGMAPVLTVASSNKAAAQESFIGIGVSEENQALCSNTTENDSVNSQTSGEESLTTILVNGGNLSPNAGKKKGVRVSFSELPPEEIEPTINENLKDNRNTPCEFAKKGSATLSSLKCDRSSINSAPSSELKETTLVCDHLQFDKEKETARVNEVDQINELLMDILEEIEGESISLDQCLFDLVTENLLSLNTARSVSLNFDKFYRCSCVGHLSDYSCDDVSNEEHERAVEKLLDVLTNLGLAKLLKCRNCIWGRLCQLASYKDFQTAQNAAMTAHETSKTVENLRGTSNALSVKDETSIPISTGPCLPSGEESELSATESDDDFYLRQLRRHHSDAMKTSIKDVDENEEGIYRECECQKIDDSELQGKVNLEAKSIIPLLIEHGAIEPRQAWLILRANSKWEQLVKVKRFLSCADKNRLEKLYQLPGLAFLRQVVNAEELDFMADDDLGRRRSTFVPTSKNSLPDAERSNFYSKSTYENLNHNPLHEVKRLVNEQQHARQNLENRITPISDILRKHDDALSREHSVEEDHRKPSSTKFSSAAASKDTEDTINPGKEI